MHKFSNPGFVGDSLCDSDEDRLGPVRYLPFSKDLIDEAKNVDTQTSEENSNKNDSDL